MTSEKDIEQLDDFLTNRLSAEDRAAFEQKLAADPELMQEFRIQSQVIEGLKEVRRMELKQLLKNTPVPPAIDSSVTLFTRWLPWVGAAVVVVMVGYFWFSTKEEPVPTSSVEQIIHPGEPAAQPENSSRESSAPAEVETEKEGSKPVVKSTQKTEPTSPNVKVEVYDPTLEEQTETTQPALEEVISATSESVTRSALAVEVIEHKKYSNHYQFKDGKLILYGSFEKDLYEILEFISEDKRSAFLYYKTAYYGLDLSQREPVKLNPINDVALLKKLKAYRER